MNEFFETIDAQHKAVGGRKLVKAMTALYIVSIFLAGYSHAESPYTVALGFMPFAACGAAMAINAFKKNASLYAWVIIAITLIAALPVALVWAVK